MIFLYRILYQVCMWMVFVTLKSAYLNILFLVIVDKNKLEQPLIKSCMPSYPKIFSGNLVSRFERVVWTIENLHLTAAKPKFMSANSEKSGYFLWNTSLSALDAISVSIVPHNFCFTEFEALKSYLQNISYMLLHPFHVMLYSGPCKLCSCM